MVQQQKRRRPPRKAWEDRFNQPGIDRLRRDLRAPEGALFDDARSELAALEDCRETLIWHGLSWKWTLEYRVGRAPHPLAVLIPNPTDLQIAVMVQPDFVRSVWNRRMKRALRDGLELAAAPFDTQWGVWSLTSQSLLDEVMDLVREKLEFAEAKPSKR
jgi:hypothetical protein